MIQRRPLIATATLLPIAARAAAAPVRGVVELFTSQGCSSCPPADRLAAELARDPSLVVISLPVTYWDRLGWKDTFGQPAFTARQEAYADGRGDGQVYTPQAVVNGTSHVVGSDRDGILRLADRRLPVTVAIGDAGITLDGPPGVSAMVLLLPVLRAREVAIGRGENARAHVTYTNIVREMRVLASYGGGASRLARPDAGADADTGFAVLVQQGTMASPGRVLGAAIV